MMMSAKDARPQDTIRRIRGILKKAGFNIEVFSWKNPVPYIWSVSVRERGCGRLSTNGKGMSRDLALASALAEFMERINTGYAWSDYSLSGIKTGRDFIFFPNERWFPAGGSSLPSGILNNELRRFYDPAGELKPSGLVYRVSAFLRGGICAVPFRRVSDEAKVFFPLNLLDNLYASNGMASGNTPAEARVQALSEIIERYVKYRVIREGIALPLVPKRYYSRLPEVREALSALSRRGFTARIKDASLGGRYPAVNIVLGERGSKKCFSAFGAHPSFETALCRTLSELLQGQDLGSFYGLQEPCRRLRDAADPANLEAHFIDCSGLVYERCLRKTADSSFHHPDFRGTRAEEYEYLLSVFRKARRDVYIADFPESSFYSCRIVVPGMSEVYPVSDLVLSNNNNCVEVCRTLLKLPVCGKKDLEGFLRGLDRKYVGDNQFVSHAVGIAAGKGSPWEDLCFGELRLLALLALGRREEARRQLLWCLESGRPGDPAAVRVYKCLAFLLDEGWAGDKIRSYFSAGTVETAAALLQGRDVFSRLFDGQGRLRGTSMHDKVTRCFLLARRMREKTK